MVNLLIAQAALVCGRRLALHRSLDKTAYVLVPVMTVMGCLADLIDIKARLSLLWLFALLNYLYADVIAPWDIIGTPDHHVHLPAMALMASAVLMEIPIAMIVAARLLPFAVNRRANIVFGIIVSIVNGFLTYVPPLAGWARTPALPEYLFFATIETVCTSIIVWQAWRWTREAHQPNPG